MIHSNAELARAIRNRSSEYTIEEIFSSRYLSSYISGVITAMCENFERRPSLTVEYKLGSNETAYTDGNRIYCNSASPLIRELKTPYKMFVSLFGHCSHEMGHTLFTAFDFLNPLRKNWAIGVFDYTPKMPVAKGAKEFKDYLNAHPNYRALYVESMCNLVNVLEDVYIENMIRTEFAGLATVGLQVSNDEKYRLFPYEEKLFQQVLDNETTPLDVAVWLIQMRKLGYKTKSNGKTTTEQQIVKDFIYCYIDSIEDEINELCWESSGYKRAMLFNEIFVKLQDLLPRPEADQDYQCMPSGEGQSGSSEQDDESSQQEGQSSEGSGENQSSKGKGSSGESKEGESGDNSSNSSGSSDRDLTKEEKEKLSKSSSENSKEAGMSAEAKGDSSSLAKGNPDKEKAEAEKQAAKDLANSEKALEDLYDELKKGLAQEETLSKDEAEHLKQLEKEATEFNNHSKKVENARFRKYKIDRDSYVTAINNKALYDEIYAEVSSTSKSLARKINNILKDDAEIEEFETGYLFGSRLSTKDLYRQDGKNFARLNTPGETKHLVMGLLIDESGSMHSGNKSIKARKAAILLEDALRRINIPLLIVGHTTDDCDVLLKPYVDPDSHDGRDKYRLANITAYAGNIDGAAIKYMKDKLQKRPEEIKVLIVISDGLPAGVSFYSNYDQREDTKLAVKDCRKNGIKVFSAIVDDYEDVASLYDPQYCFDCTDPSGSGKGKILEKNICTLVKKYVLINQN